MIKLEDLRHETDSALYGLTADDSLKYRILQKAAQTSVNKKQRMHPFPILCSVLALLLLMLVGLNQIRPLSPVTPGEMTVFAAGGTDEISIPAFSSIEASDVSSLELASVGTVNDPDLCYSLIKTLQSNSKPAAIDNIPDQDKLLIHMKNGCIYEYAAYAPYLSDGVCWECQSFFSMIETQYSD